MSLFIDFCCEVATPEPQTPGFGAQSSMPALEFAPILVKINYSLRNPADGVQFVLPSDAYPYVRVSHSFVSCQVLIVFRSGYLMRTPPRLLPIPRDVGFHASIIYGRSARGSSNSSSQGI